MTDKTTHNKKNTDNKGAEMAQNEQMDEVLSQVLNTDDSSGGTELSESNDEAAEKLQAEIDELKDKHLRLVAEFDNFRRRNAKEKMELTQTAGKEIIESLLVVLDDMERAEKQMENTTDASLVKEGIALIFNKLKKTMQAKGLKVMEAANAEFNPDLHEAITEIPVPAEDMKGKIIDVVEQGYYLNDKLIRHAKVVVGK